MANELFSRWTYPLIEVSQDKRVALPAVKENYAGELTGIDGSLQGGLRPFSGFKEVYELDCTADSKHTTDSRVSDFFPVTFNIDFDTYGYGFVYRAIRPDLFASTSWTFTDDMPALQHITLTDSAGTTKTYRAVATGDLASNGAIAPAVSASGPIITFKTGTWEGSTNNKTTIKLISTTGKTRTYEATTLTGFGGQVLENGNIGFSVDNDNAATTAGYFKSALESSNGHNGEIVCAIDTATLTLSQSSGGVAGNTTVTPDADFLSMVTQTSISSFTGGLDSCVGFKTDPSWDQNDTATALRDAILSSNGHNGTILVVWTAGTGKLTLTQTVKGSEGNTAITVSSGWEARVDGSMPLSFVGGADTGEADIFLDFYLAGCGTWSKGNLIKANVSTTEPMDVKSTGRIIMVAMSGVSPTAFYVSKVKPDSTFSDPDSIYCIQVGECTSSADGVYCPASARFVLAEEDNDAADAAKASATWTFTNYAVNDSHILIQSTDGTTRRYRATDGGTNGTQEVVGGVIYTQFNSGRSKATATWTFNAQVDAAETIKLIDGDFKERTYKCDAAAQSTVLSSQQATATCTFTSAAPEGSTITLMDTAGLSKTYVARSSGSTGDLEGTNVIFNRGSSGNDTVNQIRTALTHSNGHNGTITAADPSGGSVLTMTQTTAGDGNTVITTSGLSTATDPDLPARFSGGGKTISFLRGGDANDAGQTITNAINSSNGHNGSIVAAWTAGSGKVDVTQAIYHDTNTSSTITHSAGFDGFCSVNPPDAFAIPDSTATQKAAAATNFKAAVDDANGHNATNGRASLTFNFDADYTTAGGGAVANSLLSLISYAVSGNVSKTYKATATEADHLTLDGSAIRYYKGTSPQTAAENLAAAINSRHGHNGKDQSATVQIAFNGPATTDGTIQLIGAGATSSDATKTVRYKATATQNNQNQIDSGDSSVLFYRGTTAAESAENLIRAINTTNGHLATATKIVCADAGNGHVLLTQYNEGAHGETAITYGGSINSSLVQTPSSFDNGTIATENYRFEVSTVAVSSDHKITITQVNGGVDKDTPAGQTSTSVAGSFNDAIDGTVPAAFSGGIFSGSTNARFTVTAVDGKVTMTQTTGGSDGNTRIQTSNSFLENTNPDPPYRFSGGGTVIDGAEVQLENTSGEKFVYHFDTDSTLQDGSTNSDGEYIVGIQNASTIPAQTTAFYKVLEASKSTTEFTVFKIDDNELLVRQTVPGEAGNTTVVLNTQAARFITVTGFSGGTDPTSSSSSSSSSTPSCLAEYFLVIENTPGPGLKPSLDSPVLSDVDYSVLVPEDSNRPAKAKLFLSDQHLNDGDFWTAGKLLADSDLPIFPLIDRSVNELVLLWNEGNPDDELDCDGIYTDTDGGADDITDSTSVDNPECITISDVVPFVGSSYGGHVAPNTSGAFTTNYCVYENDSIEEDNFVNQLPLVTNYVYIKESTDLANIAVDIQFRKKNLDSGSFDNFSYVIKNGHLKVDQASSTSIFTYDANQLGGYFAIYRDEAGRNKSFAVEHQPALASNLSGITCYVMYTNLQEFFNCDHFSPGDYEFKVTLKTVCCSSSSYMSSTFAWSVGEGACNFGAQSTEQAKDKTKLEPGNYVFAYNLYDSKTGRTSALSDISQALTDSFRYSNESTSSDRYASIEMIYDHDKYDYAYLYRSVKTQDAGGTFTAGVLGLDKIIRLKDYRTLREQPSTTGYSRAVYTYELGDLELIYRPTYSSESPLYDQYMPYGGKLEWFGNTLMITRVRNTPKSSTDEISARDTLRSIGELRWSSMIEVSPELFAPTNRFVPPTPSNEMIALKMVGDSVYGFSHDRIYNIRKEASRSGGYMRVMEMHEGFGITGPSALEAVGSSVYYMTPKGVKAVNVQGRLDDVKAFDDHIMKNWPRDLSGVQCAFDPSSSVMFWLHPDQEEALCLWFNSSKSSILKDMAFKSVKRGPWPSDPTNYNDDLIDRALFLQNPPSLTQGFRPRIYVHDYKYEKKIVGSGTPSSNGATRITMMDGDGDVRFKTSGSASSSVITLDNTDGSLVSNSWVGSYLYVTDSSNSSMIGKKAKIVSIAREDIDELVSSSSDFTHTATAAASNYALVTVEGSELDGLPDDSRICLSPIYFRWIGHNLDQRSEEGITFAQRDFHRTKHMETVSATFTDVSGPPTTDSNSDNRFNALAFEGASLTPVDTAYPLDLNGSKVASVVSGEGSHSAAFGGDDTLAGKYGIAGSSISPGIEVYCSDLDFLLLSVKVEGRVRDSSTTSRPQVGI